MRTVCTILVFVFCIMNLNAQDELLENAERAYDSKKYKEAIKAYESLIEKGYSAYELYFNLGNSYYRNDQLGKAIYNYELARKMEPDDEDVRVNLAIASSKTIDKIDSRENFFISAVKTNLLSSFSTKTWGWISIFSLLIAAVGFFIFVSVLSVNFKKLAFVASAVGLLIFIFSYFLGYSALRSKYENKFAIITVPEVKVMNEPTKAASSKFSLHEGTKIRVVETNGDWLLIKLDNGNEGWLRLADVGVI